MRIPLPPAQFLQQLRKQEIKFISKALSGGTTLFAKKELSDTDNCGGVALTVVAIAMVAANIKNGVA